MKLFELYLRYIRKTNKTMIKTYKEACEKLGLNHNNLPDVSSLPEEHQQSIITYYSLIIIAEALNEGWKPNWNDSNEKKWYPYFDMRSGGSFDDSYFVYWFSTSSVGSRLCFKNRELAEYAGKQFEELYKDFLYKFEKEDFEDIKSKSEKYQLALYEELKKKFEVS